MKSDNPPTHTHQWTHLLSTLIKEHEKGALRMSKAALLNKGIEDLRVEEEPEERPLIRGGAMLEEQLLVEQVGYVSGSLRGGGEEGCETLPVKVGGWG